MRLGIIDLGTNSVRFDVHQIGPGRRLKLLHREKIMVRLGQGVFLNRKLDRGAIRRTLHAFTRFSRLSKQYRTGKIVAFGTSALREAQDADRLLDEIRKKTGIHVRVIPGSEEAQLIGLGILSNEEVPKKTFCLVDIGGGSTEISICRGRKTLHSMSFPLGTARIQQVYLNQSPPAQEALKNARQHIRNTLYQVSIPERWPKAELVIASSGTARALARMLQKKSKPGSFTAEDLGALVARMSELTTGELLEISKMEAKRVDMILAGAVLMSECMDVFGAAKVRVTPYSLRDGILEEELQLGREGSSSHLALHFDTLYEKAEALGQDRAHLERLAKVADELFERLAPLHRLAPTWKSYLIAAVIFRNTGEAIGPSRHAAHSWYVVKNADLPAMEDWEIDLVAELCLFHESSKVTFGNTDLSVKTRSTSFLKLLALLRIVDALDFGPDTRTGIASVKLTRTSVKLGYRGRNLTGLEQTNLELRSRLFRRVFKRGISPQLVRKRSARGRA